jgi:hypothetical protein
MAGNFTINVVVSGGGTGGGEGGGGGTGGRVQSAVAAATAGSVLNQLGKTSSITPQIAKAFELKQETLLQVLNQSKLLGNEGTYQIRARGSEGRFIAGYTSIEDAGDGFKTFKHGTITGGPQFASSPKSFWKPAFYKQPISAKFYAQMLDPDGNSTKLGEDVGGPIGQLKLGYGGTAGWQDMVDNTRQHFVKHKRKYGAIVSLTAVKAIQSSVAITKHQSGDSYANQQLDNMVRLATSIGVLTYAAATNPVIAAGLVINEAFNIFTSKANFDFDRKMERYEITNNMIAAGNASYGRMRGIGV